MAENPTFVYTNVYCLALTILYKLVEGSRGNMSLVSSLLSGSRFSSVSPVEYEQVINGFGIWLCNWLVWCSIYKYFNSWLIDDLYDRACVHKFQDARVSYYL